MLSIENLHFHLFTTPEPLIKTLQRSVNFRSPLPSSTSPIFATSSVPGPLVEHHRDLDVNELTLPNIFEPRSTQNFSVQSDVWRQLVLIVEFLEVFFNFV